MEQTQVTEFKSLDKDFEHKERLVETALEEFIEHGYEQASINTILHRARMSKGQFYYHFKNKEDLYFALIDMMIHKKTEFLKSVMSPADMQGDFFGIMETQIGHSMAFTKEYPAIARFSERFLKEQGSPIFQKAMEKYDFRSNQGIQMMVEQAYKRGEFRKDLPLPFVQKLVGFLFNHIVDLMDNNDVDSFEGPMVYLIEFMRSGLANQGEVS
jgi:AcrR family transcriptional regulator